MSYEEIAHGKFAIERIYDVPRARVFSAWADPAVKARWFIGPEGWTQIERQLGTAAHLDRLAHQL